MISYHLSHETNFISFFEHAVVEIIVIYKFKYTIKVRYMTSQDRFRISLEMSVRRGSFEDDFRESLKSL